jgi:hypothetical protein
VLCLPTNQMAATGQADDTVAALAGLLQAAADNPCSALQSVVRLTRAHTALAHAFLAETPVLAYIRSVLSTMLSVPHMTQEDSAHQVRDASSSAPEASIKQSDHGRQEDGDVSATEDVKVGSFCLLHLESQPGLAGFDELETGVFALMMVLLNQNQQLSTCSPALVLDLIETLLHMAQPEAPVLLQEYALHTLATRTCEDQWCRGFDAPGMAPVFALIRIITNTGKRKPA